MTDSADKPLRPAHAAWIGIGRGEVWRSSACLGEMHIYFWMENGMLFRSIWSVGDSPTVDMIRRGESSPMSKECRWCRAMKAEWIILNQQDETWERYNQQHDIWQRHRESSHEPDDPKSLPVADGGTGATEPRGFWARVRAKIAGYIMENALGISPEYGKRGDK